MNRNRLEARRWTRLGAAVWLAAFVLPGCRHAWLRSNSHVLEQAAGDSGDYETLVLTGGTWEKPPAPQPGTPQGDLQLADALFQAEDYSKAAEAFDEVTDKHKNDAAVHERALFMKAESLFKQGEYTKARDGYEELLKTYPGSSQRAAADQRLFAIGDLWMEDAREDVRHGRPGSFPRRFLRFERGKPLFDIDGHAEKALESSRTHDPNGPLADDSLMMQAGYHFSVGNPREADHYLDQLIHTYPRSEHQAQAHLLSAEAKLQSHKGSKYDSRQLEEARRTLQAALNQYPTELEPERQRVYGRLDEIRQQQAKSQFEVAEWYERQKKPQAARIYYDLVQAQFPGTKWADRSAERIARLDHAARAAELAKPKAAADEPKTSSAEHEAADADPASRSGKGILSKIAERLGDL